MEEENGIAGETIGVQKRREVLEINGDPHMMF